MREGSVQLSMFMDEGKLRQCTSYIFCGYPAVLYKYVNTFGEIM